MSFSLPCSLKVLPGRLGSVLFLVLFSFASRGHAGSATWDTSPASNDWNTAGNWTPDVVPNGAADVASFGSSSVTSISLSSDVQLAGMTFNSGASAFTISKQNISLSGGITNSSSSVETILSDLTLTGNQTFASTMSALQFGSFVGAGDGAVNLQGFTLTTTSSAIGPPVFNGVISGTGILNISSGEATVLNAANTYSGGTRLGNGALAVNNAAALGTGALTVINSNNNLRNASGSAITLNNNPLILSGGSLSFAGGSDLSFGTGAVTLSGSAGNNRTLDVESNTLTLDGLVSDGGSNMGITIEGGGILVLGGENSFTHFVRIQSGTVSVSDIGNTGLTSNLGTNGTINFGSTTAAGGPGTLRYTGTGETTDKVLNLASNSLTGGAVIDQSGTGLLKFTSDFTATGTASKSVTLQGSTAGIGEIAGAIVDPSTTHKISVVKEGTGTWILSGTNSYTGTTTVNAGTLRVNGSITSAVTVNGPGPFNTVGGTLAGSGTTGAVTVNNGGALSPGNSPGILNVQGDLSLALGSTYLVDLNGSAVGTGYDQTNVTGSVSLGHATLSLNVGFTAAPGNAFTIINNDQADAITGTFNGLGQGATIIAGGQTFIISYTGGDGNDVVLTAVPEPSTWSLLVITGAFFISLRSRRNHKLSR